MSASAKPAPQRAPSLEWHEPGEPAYHIETACGRYTVSRVTVSARGLVFYVAWRLVRDGKGRVSSREEIGSESVPIAATAEQRAVAREAMRARCEEDALS